ncbi:MAG: hypothetical protein EHM70_00850 [Chloroflexota bacterium]|nr:MAG: hypothetical protein EHM70_00850 [Chloroflexota bacterium]
MQIGYEVVEQVCTTTLYESVRKNKPDVILNLASCFEKQDADLLPAVLQLTGAPYTGSGITGLSLGRNYLRLFQLLYVSGIPLPNFIVIESGSAAGQTEIPYPLTLYGENQSRGSLVRNPDELKRQVDGLPTHEEVLLVEYSEDRSTGIYILDNQILACPTDPQICEAALKVYELIEARGMARFDFVLSGQARLVGMDPAPFPLDDELLRQLNGSGWDEKKLLKSLVEHARRDL